MRIQPSLELNPAQANSPAKVDKVARQLEGQFAQFEGYLLSLVSIPR